MDIRRYISYVVAVIIATLVMVACQEEQDRTPVVIIPPQNEAPTYTLIYLAVGGDTLDEAIERSIEKFQKASQSKNVKLTANIKWTKGYTSALSSGEGEVCRFVIGKEGDAVEPQIVGDNSYALYEPENIAEFIRWSKEVAPADNYILLIAGHGNGWHPEVAHESTRGTLRDTDLGRYTSLEELCRGIELSGTHFRMIQMISCLMNNMEYVTALSEYTDYIFGSCHVSLMLCSELQWLQMSLRSIEKEGAEEFVEAMKEYMGYIKMDMRLLDLQGEKVDFSITDCNHVEELNGAIREFTDALITLYDESDTLGGSSFADKYGCSIADIEGAMADAYYFISAHLTKEEMTSTEYMRMAFTYDLVDLTTKVAETSGITELIEAAKKIDYASRLARIINYTTRLHDIEEVFYGITLTNSEQWVARKYAEGGYCETLFDKLTGWSRLLMRNNVELQY